jgi:hypothetical protein
MDKTTPFFTKPVPQKMTQQPPHGTLDELLGFDPLQEAEIMTGCSYNEDEATSSIGLLLAVGNNQKKKELLKANKDSYYGMSFAEFVVLKDSMGFKSVASGTIPNSEDEWFIGWREGILVVYDSFRGSLNSAKAFFNYLPLSDNSYRKGFSGTAFEGPSGKNVWCGDFDAREGFKHRLGNYEETGIFLKEWIKQPFLWLLHHGDSKVDGYDFDKINQQRIAMLPPEVQEAIFGVKGG